jgi:hypothetical protein
VPNSFAVCRLRVVVNPRKSERTQQNCANEREHGAHRQHIELQGMIHDAPPIEGRTKCNRLCRLAEARRRYAPSLSTGRAMQIGNKASKRLITRRKKFSQKILAVQNRVARGRFGAISNEWTKNSARVPATK